MNQSFEYLQRRLEPQEKWPDKRARVNKWLFSEMQEVGKAVAAQKIQSAHFAHFPA